VQESWIVLAQVRQLRTQGLTYRRIETLTGVPAGYCSNIVRRGARVTEFRTDLCDRVSLRSVPLPLVMCDTWASK
jgi:hypothetical protein